MIMIGIAFTRHPFFLLSLPFGARNTKGFLTCYEMQPPQSVAKTIIIS